MISGYNIQYSNTLDCVVYTTCVIKETCKGKRVVKCTPPPPLNGSGSGSGSSADRVYVSLGTAGTYPGYGPVYRNVPW